MAKKTKKVQKVEALVRVPAGIEKQARTDGAWALDVAAEANIQTAPQEEEAYGLLRRIAATKKNIEKERTKITKPLLDSKRQIDALFRKLASPFVEADEAIRDKILEFRREEERKARVEEERLRKEAEEAAEQAELCAEEADEADGRAGQEWEESAEEWEAEAEEKEEQALSTRPAVAAATKTVKRWTYEVVDFAKLPDEYKAVNTTAIGRAVREGVRDVPGLRIYQAESVRI